jgi:2-dehydropantoate 2-reductase
LLDPADACSLFVPNWSSIMKVCILGIGAMGCLFAARLTDLTEVMLVGHWKEQLSALTNQGLLMIQQDGSQSRHAVIASEHVTEHNTYDIVLVLVKGWQSQRAAEISEKLIRENGLVLSLQNGLGNLEILAKSVGRERVVQGVTSEGATLIKPGVVRHAGSGITYLAKTKETERRLTAFTDLLRLAQFDTHLIDNPESLIWGKLAVNAGINPLTGLLQVPNGYLATHSVARSLMSKAAKETEAVALAQNITLPYADAAEQALQVAQATATNRSSMAQDVARGAPTEIDSICGAIVHFGQELTIPTPINLALLVLVKNQIDQGNWIEEINNLPLEIQDEFRSLTIQKTGI